MAVHARLRGRNVRDGRNLDRGVTVAAIETKLADVELVAVRDGLNGTVAHVRVPRGKVVPDARDREHRTEAARDGGHDRELVPPRGKDLGHWLGLRGAGGQFHPGPPGARESGMELCHILAHRRILRRERPECRRSKPESYPRTRTGSSAARRRRQRHHSRSADRRDRAPSTSRASRTCAAYSAQTFSKASDSASLGSRSGTSACRRISQLAAATKHPPTARSAATSSSDGLSPSGWSVGMTCQ